MPNDYFFIVIVIFIIFIHFPIIFNDFQAVSFQRHLLPIGAAFFLVTDNKFQRLLHDIEVIVKWKKELGIPVKDKYSRGFPTF
ncbi:hypothetical protein BFJ68_g16641 [Fusarium oxysporum]|uniref:Uncharacterized protein n=1 Tax=Fusarium oxysporum TaxID=5507 RepID=A0A420PB51_FUSOX|nr:hypothetical protein BFJ68_g16641 [Fusarium oxysporum]